MAEAAEHEGVSLNQYVLALLSRRDVGHQIERRLQEPAAALGAIAQQLIAVARQMEHGYSFEEATAALSDAAAAALGGRIVYPETATVHLGTTPS